MMLRLRRGRMWARRHVAATAVAWALATPAAAAEYAVAPGQTAVGEIGRHTIAQGEIFPDLARRFDLGYTALAAANPGTDPWVPAAGQAIRIPALYVLPAAPHAGIVLNLGQWRLFYFPPGGGRVLTVPVGLGVIGRKTPLGASRVVRKEPNPAWYPPPSIRAEEPNLPTVVPPGPDNPLGAFALRLGWPNYLIHGTNKPDGVGRNVSHGCIRLYPEDIQTLFNAVPVGTPVRTVYQPATAGWLGDRLYLAVYPSQTQTEAIDTERPVPPEPATGVRAVVTAAAGAYAGSVDWGAVERAAQQRTGLPVPVADKSGAPFVSSRDEGRDEAADGGYYPPMPAPPAYGDGSPAGGEEAERGGEEPGYYPPYPLPDSGSDGGYAARFTMPDEEAAPEDSHTFDH